ncbi:MAG: antibiotic biosynthesis monooxygenase family protein [Terracidiphilus sp.]|jgi:heme-degrading monooxygenase HmoA
MIQCISVYRVAVENAKAFVAAVRGANLWRELSRQMSMSPGLIAADLLRSKALGSLYISIEFWHSEEALREAENSAAHTVYELLLSQLTVSWTSLGTFSFPPTLEDQERSRGLPMESMSRLKEN